MSIMTIDIITLVIGALILAYLLFYFWWDNIKIKKRFKEQEREMLEELEKIDGR